METTCYFRSHRYYKLCYYHMSVLWYGRQLPVFIPSPSLCTTTIATDTALYTYRHSYCTTVGVRRFSSHSLQLWLSVRPSLRQSVLRSLFHTCTPRGHDPGTRSSPALCLFFDKFPWRSLCGASESTPCTPGGVLLTVIMYSSCVYNLLYATTTTLHTDVQDVAVQANAVYISFQILILSLGTIYASSFHL